MSRLLAELSELRVKRKCLQEIYPLYSKLKKELEKALTQKSLPRALRPSYLTLRFCNVGICTFMLVSN